MKMTEEPIHFAAVENWRSSLEQNHATEADLWLTIYKKHSETPSVTVQEAMREPICFGWIDSSMEPIDEQLVRTQQGMAARLIEEGRMTEAGLAKIEEAKRNGRWTGPLTR
jgi:uncharacterized protein YdeI (YjbR/CyaY-like superfamily)